MALSLPYRTAGRQPQLQIIGPEGGPLLEITAYGKLLQGEAELIQDVEEQADLYAQTARVAVAVANQHDIGKTDAHKIVTRLLSYHLFGNRIELDDREAEINVVSADLIADLVKHVSASEKRISRRRATALIRYRIAGCEHWTDDDTARQPADFIDALVAFAQQEISGATEPLDPEAALQQLESDLGKLRPEPSSHDGPTGVPSTGTADASTPAIPNSAPSASPGSQPRTSSRRLRKA